jgi:hypothetical protein
MGLGEIKCSGGLRASPFWGFWDAWPGPIIGWMESLTYGKQCPAAPLNGAALARMRRRSAYTQGRTHADAEAARTWEAWSSTGMVGRPRS